MKICVYAICKNEEKFVDRWISSLIDEADYIKVLDTGSTDNTINELKKYEPKVEVQQKIISPWRFDTARNESMKMIPTDADICCVADLDQVWRKGWSKAIKDAFEQGYTEVSGDIINYNGDEVEGMIVSRNVHPNDPDWWWERPIHEGLYYHGNKECKSFFSKDFIIEHRQDKSKSRGNYLNQLEMWYNDETSAHPNGDIDPYCGIYYGCELGFHGFDDKANQVFLDTLYKTDLSKNPEIRYQLCLNIAFYYSTRNNEEALKYCLGAESTGIITRKLYKAIAEAYSRLNDLNKAIEYYEKALDIHMDSFGWVEDRELHQLGRIEKDLSIAYYYANNFEKAYFYGNIANKYCHDEMTESNLDYYKESLKEELPNVLIYAICKNEEKNIERWINSLAYADKIVLIDTGSTDSTCDIIEKYRNERNIDFIKTYPSTIDFSRFKNFALNNAIEDIREDNNWVFVNLDIDEFLDRQSIFNIKYNWMNNCYDRMNITGINPDGSSQILNHRIHSCSRDWKWMRRVHETLRSTSKKNYLIGNSDAIYYHEQDTSKARDYYNLLQLEAEDNEPIEDKTLTLVYCAWEAQLHNEFDKAIEYCNRCLQLKCSEELKIQCYLYLYDLTDNKEECIVNLESMIDKNRIRRLYKLLGDYYLNNDLEKSIKYYTEGYKCNFSNSWLEDSSLTNEVFYSSLSNLYSNYIKDYLASYVYASLANDKSEDLENKYNNYLKEIGINE